MDEGLTLRGKNHPGNALQPLANWGNYPRSQSEVIPFTSDEEATARLLASPGIIPRGLGRCYGDSALAAKVLATRGFRQIIEWSAEEGTVTCEAGTSLGELLEILVPQGWFLPVVPGTKHVTVGGAIASDIHGKNHHLAGTFSRHVLWLDLLTPDGAIRRLTPSGNPELFSATAGGMGLTGLILRAALRLVPIRTAFVRSESLVAKDLNDAMRLFQESAGWTYSVAWIDCQSRRRNLGRSILFRGEHADPGDLGGSMASAPLELGGTSTLSVPFFLPKWTLNSFSVRAFNALYYRKQALGRRESLTRYDTFFFPLDRVNDWNRIYGRRGFLQYQFVLPQLEGERGLATVLERIAASGLGSFLAVLKLMGEGTEMLSFPLKGYTLALDFPASPSALDLCEELDRLVLESGGRLYLTKDARMTRAMLDEGYPDVQEFRAMRQEIDPSGAISSLQSQRLGL